MFFFPFELILMEKRMYTTPSLVIIYAVCSDLFFVLKNVSQDIFKAE